MIKVVRRSGGFAAFAATALATCHATAACADGLPSLPELQSHNGVLAATLTAAPADVDLAGAKIAAYAFNGAYAGPVLVVSRGDRVRLHVINNVARPINLHFHGLHVTPLGHGDNMYVMVAQGASYDYDFRVPLSQPAGLYWYHTHVHGISEDEINRGLSGALIVRGVEGCAPDITAMRQRLMVLKTFTTDARDQEALKQLHGLVQTINGVAPIQLDMDVGAPQFWRLGNQSPNDYYHLRADGFRFAIAGVDGAPTHGRIEVDALDIPPGGTMEVIVTPPPSPGRYSLLSGSTPTGLGRQMKVNRELATIDVAPAQGPAIAASADFSSSAAARACVTDLSAARVTGARTLIYSQKPGEEIYLIDGKTFDHSRTDVRVPLGAIEDWTIRNDTDDMHTFHIHQVHFQVMAVNGQPQPFAGVIDVVRVPERGSVTVRIPFTDPQIVGRFMYHCHVLKHEDKGMMATIEVYDPKHPNANPMPPMPKM